jgi:hypothetical protein
LPIQLSGIVEAEKCPDQVFIGDQEGAKGHPDGFSMPCLVGADIAITRIFGVSVRAV